ncbi:hypothetical protein [Polynucleobacter kasalickyi]|uniref:Uncharacterized protein n=1 Tax=Polynucleobacter kasalickyi TaxID=1938817 RepID=A0A1W2A7S0_9BURK|nr:hypothetical protein SAMN06296008_1083 [Polynucleobacter kasalickyi]
MRRVHRVQNRNTNDRVGYCLDILDLFLSKAIASREKDREFCMALLEYDYLRVEDALNLVTTMPIEEDDQRRLRATIRRWARAL